jgi:HAD superfamily hydrolase (TIGR01490 family)
MADEKVTRRVAAFDFDGTLVPADSLVPFVWRVAGVRRFVAAAARRGPRVALATGLHVGSRDAAKAAFLRTALHGLAFDDVAAEGRNYAAELVRKVDPTALRRIAWHRGEGHQLVLVSASLEVYLEPLGRALGFDTVLATRLELDGRGLLTGGLVGANVRGAEKVDRLRSWLDGEASELWAYGDSAGDRELLAAADHAVRIGRRGFPDLQAG